MTVAPQSRGDRDAHFVPNEVTVATMRDGRDPSVARGSGRLARVASLVVQGLTSG
jgi:hypothetical protein